MELIKLNKSAQQRKPSTKLRQHTEWEKIFDNDTSDKRNMCKIYKKIHTTQKAHTPIKHKNGQRA